MDPTWEIRGMEKRPILLSPFETLKTESKSRADWIRTSDLCTPSAEELF